MMKSNLVKLSVNQKFRYFRRTALLMTSPMMTAASPMTMAPRPMLICRQSPDRCLQDDLFKMRGSLRAGNHDRTLRSRKFRWSNRFRQKLQRPLDHRYRSRRQHRNMESNGKRYRQTLLPKQKGGDGWIFDQSYYYSLLANLQRDKKQ